MYSILAVFGLSHAYTKVASTLFYHLSSLRFTSSQFAPTSLFASASASASAKARCSRSLSHVCSSRLFIPVPPFVFCCRCTSVKAPYRYLPPLTCWLKSLDTAKNSTAFDVRSVSPLPSSSYFSSSISSYSVASSISSTSSNSSSTSPSLLLLSYSSDSETPSPRTASRSTSLSPS